MFVPLMPPGTMEGIVTNGTMAGVLTNGMMTGASTVLMFTSQRTRKLGDLHENQAKRNGESYILFPVLPAASTLQPEERFCGGFWSKHACGHEERP